MTMLIGLKQLIMRRRSFAIAASAIVIFGMLVTFQNCAGRSATSNDSSVSSSGNGGSYGGGNGIFMGVHCVSDQNASNGQPVEISIRSDQDIISKDISTNIHQYVGFGFVLQVDVSQVFAGKYAGQMTYEDKGKPTYFTAHCD